MKLKKEKTALQMFCNEDSPITMYRRPFINDADNGRVMATTGYIMALVDAKLLRHKYEHDWHRLPDYDYGRKDFERVVDFANVYKAFNQLPLTPEKVSKDGKDKECTECDGSGTVEYEYTAGDGQTYYVDHECPICEGTGVREDYDETETGRMILQDDCSFGLGNMVLHARYFMRVVSALQMMGFERMTWRSTQGYANIFDVCDGFTVLVMALETAFDSHKAIELIEKV